MGAITKIIFLHSKTVLLGSGGGGGGVFIQKQSYLFNHKISLNRRQKIKIGE